MPTHTTHTSTLQSRVLLLLRYVAPIFVLFAFLGVGCSTRQEQAEPVELVFWGVFDGRDVYDPLIKKYQALHPNVKISYSKLDPARYEQELIEALAAGRGPDLWLMQNVWLPRHLDKITPAPGSAFTGTQIKNEFVDTVYEEFVLEPAPTTENPDPAPLVYGVPLYVDTLALYYNKDLLQSEGIVTPPETWNEFAQDVQRLTETDDFGSVTRSAVALGTSSNVERATDILSMLMLQNDTTMVDLAKQKAVFDEAKQNSAGNRFFPGLDALIFYTDFANPEKVVFTWDPTRDNSVDAFVNEDVAFLFHYQYTDAAIRARAPQLNYEIAPVPQIEGSKKDTTLANYWGHVVSKASPATHQSEAWKFISFLSSPENASQYAQLSGRPSSLKSIIESQLNTPSIAVFAQQALTAKNWYQQNSALIEPIFADMITATVLGTPPEEAIQTAADQVTAVMRN